MSDLDDQMQEALRRQFAHRQESHKVDRRGWTDSQWIADAERLMSDPEGAITSLVNGHVVALLRMVRLLRETNELQALKIRKANQVFREIDPEHLRVLATYVEVTYPTMTNLPSQSTEVEDNLRQWADLVEEARKS